MSRPIALLLGIIDHAQKEWKALSDVADLIVRPLLPTPLQNL